MPQVLNSLKKQPSNPYPYLFSQTPMLFFHTYRHFRHHKPNNTLYVSNLTLKKSSQMIFLFLPFAVIAKKHTSPPFITPQKYSIFANQPNKSQKILHLRNYYHAKSHSTNANQKQISILTATIIFANDFVPSICQRTFMTP